MCYRDFRPNFLPVRSTTFPTDLRRFTFSPDRPFTVKHSHTIGLGAEDALHRSNPGHSVSKREVRGLPVLSRDIAIQKNLSGRAVSNVGQPFVIPLPSSL